MMEDVAPSEPQAQAAVVHPSWFVDFLAERWRDAPPGTPALGSPRS